MPGARFGCTTKPEAEMPSIFYIIGVVVVIIAVLGFFGLR
jgi:hypothetical protein